jgi:exodeoxyribonuclease VII small subunit
MMRNPDQNGPMPKISRQRRYHAIFGTGMSKRSQQSPPKTFEDALRELEEILSEIENGNVGLEESLVKYERGNFLIQHCRGVLSAAEKQIESMEKPDEGTADSTSEPAE